MDNTWNKEKLKKASEINIDEVVSSNVQDISTHVINTELPTSERIKTFLSQTDNPYIMKSGNLLIKVAFSKDSNKNLSDLLSKIVTRYHT